MSQTHFVPRADSHFDSWQQNYATYAVDHSHDLALSPGQVKTLQDLRADWVKRYQELIEARAILAAAAQAKDNARAAYESFIRAITAQIQKTPDITDAQRAALGVSLPRANGPAFPPPATAPRTAIDAAQRLSHRLRIVDESTPLRAARPRGVAAAQVFCAKTAPGTDAPVDLDAYRFMGAFSRYPAVINFTGEDAGMTAHYLVRWTNPRGQPGPWGPTASATILG